MTVILYKTKIKHNSGNLPAMYTGEHRKGTSPAETTGYLKLHTAINYSGGETKGNPFSLEKQRF